jgi:inosose dehydratase
VTIRVANAPCSYGAFEVTVGVLPNVPGPEEVLEAITEAGYEGTELGPPGYLGHEEMLRARLERFGLALVGAYVPIRLSEREHWDEDLRALELTLDLLDTARGEDEARPVFADAGPAAELSDAGWGRLADGVARAAELARARGFEPTFHHHMGTHVERPRHVERLLETTDVPLLLDTGHLVLAGGDPAEALRAWGPRINHLHVKDARTEVIRESADMSEAWLHGVFCELGAGDVDLAAFFAVLAESGYSGWLVVEQDWIPAPGEDAAEAIEAQERNRRWLRANAGL